MTSNRDRTASAPLRAPAGLKAHRVAEDVVVFELPLPQPKSLDELTEAEAEVARSVYKGLSNRQIAEQRGVSVRTVSNQVESIFRKLNVNSRMELILKLRSEPES